MATTRERQAAKGCGSSDAKKGRSRLGSAIATIKGIIIVIANLEDAVVEGLGQGVPCAAGLHDNGRQRLVTDATICDKGGDAKTARFDGMSRLTNVTNVTRAHLGGRQVRDHLRVVDNNRVVGQGRVEVGLGRAQLTGGDMSDKDEQRRIHSPHQSLPHM